MKEKFCAAALLLLSVVFQQGACDAAAGDLSGRDRKFVLDQAAEGLTEIKLGEVVKERATSPSIKALSEQLVKDRSSSGTALRSIASAHDFAIPSILDKEHQNVIDTLARLPESKFDEQYLNCMIDAQQKSVDELNREGDTRVDELKRWRNDTLPRQREDLNLALDVRSKLGK
jgi:predicted outer membrane protein